MRVIEMRMERRRNERAGGPGYPRENPPINGITNKNRWVIVWPYSPPYVSFVPYCPMLSILEVTNTRSAISGRIPTERIGEMCVRRGEIPCDPVNYAGRGWGSCVHVCCHQHCNSDGSVCSRSKAQPANLRLPIICRRVSLCYSGAASREESGAVSKEVKRDGIKPIIHLLPHHAALISAHRSTINAPLRWNTPTAQRYVYEILHPPPPLPFLAGIPGAKSHQDDARPTAHDTGRPELPLQNRTGQNRKWHQHPAEGHSCSRLGSYTRPAPLASATLHAMKKGGKGDGRSFVNLPPCDRANLAAAEAAWAPPDEFLSSRTCFGPPLAKTLSSENVIEALLKTIRDKPISSIDLVYPKSNKTMLVNPGACCADQSSDSHVSDGKETPVTIQDFQAGLLPDFHVWESCRTTLLVGGVFSGSSHLPLDFAFRASPISPHFTLVKGRQILSVELND
ncbi:hypothetical protein PR048_009739 [Dryococelus australis]|uniref:Uncharacterized protein n=1 Tax=Dryococelus australis TaxID=614101 RepID=A0ABQ9I0S2_9NEOP|nr:hypothetical protein PR048_009739 [Dryococelus australis]